MFKRKHDPRCRYCGVRKSAAYRAVSYYCDRRLHPLMHDFTEGQNMRLINTDDPNERRKAMKHYRAMAKEANRQRRRNDFYFKQRFATFDLILVASIASLLTMIVTLIVEHIFH